MPITVSWATPIASGSSRASMAAAGAADRVPQAVLDDAEAVVAAVSPRPLQLSQGGILIHLEHAASPRDSACLSLASHGRSSYRLSPSGGVWGCSLNTTVTTG